MAQIIQTVCDLCIAEEKEPKQGDTIRLNDVELDMCADHRSRVTLHVLLVGIEQGVYATRAHEEDDLSCPHGCNNGKPFKSMQGKRQHMTRQHK